MAFVSSESLGSAVKDIDSSEWEYEYDETETEVLRLRQRISMSSLHVIELLRYS